MDLDIKFSDGQYETFFENTTAKFKIIPKGRRFGMTQGAAQAFVMWMAAGATPFLWGDTVAGNIDRYVERYFIPVLRKLPPEVPWQWMKTKRVLYVGDAVCDFRSADRPENWEGFGYKKIFLNEAGIILKDRYLYQNAVLPMLIDFPDSQLIAAGTPKGAIGIFFELHQTASRDKSGRYWTATYPTFLNPFLSSEDVEELLQDVPASVYQQEILGRFVDLEGTRVKREWLRSQWQDPELLRTVVGVDLAIGKTDASDWVACCALGRRPDKGWHVQSVKRMRGTFFEQREFIRDFSLQWKARSVGVESNAYQMAMVQELLRTTELNVRAVNRVKDKLFCFEPVESRYEQGLISHDPDLDAAFIDELLSFGSGQGHDDMVDALVNAYEVGRRQGSGGITVHDVEEQRGGTVFGGVRTKDF